jgi:hypothetical protein
VILIQSLNDAAVMDALALMLKSWPALSDSDVTVEQAEPINESPERCPWIGLYRSRQVLEPRTLGMGSGYRNQFLTIVLVLTEQSADSGIDCSRRLSALVQSVTSAICTDQSIGGTVANIDEIDVVYADYTRDGAAFLQRAVVSITTVTPVSATIV